MSVGEKSPACKYSCSRLYPLLGSQEAHYAGELLGHYRRASLRYHLDNRLTSRGDGCSSKELRKGRNVGHFNARVVHDFNV